MHTRQMSEHTNCFSTQDSSAPRQQDHGAQIYLCLRSDTTDFIHIHGTSSGRRWKLLIDLPFQLADKPSFSSCEIAQVRSFFHHGSTAPPYHGRHEQGAQLCRAGRWKQDAYGGLRHILDAAARGDQVSYPHGWLQRKGGSIGNIKWCK